MASVNGSPVSAFAVYKQNNAKKRKIFNVSPNKKMKHGSVESAPKNVKQKKKKPRKISSLTPMIKVNTDKHEVPKIKEVKKTLVSQNTIKKSKQTTSSLSSVIQVNTNKHEVLQIPSKINRSKKTLISRNDIKKKHKKKDEPTILVPIDRNNEVTMVKKTLSCDESNNRKSNLVDTSVTDVITDLYKTDPSTEGLKLFKWLIASVTPDTFFNQFWENQSLFLKRDMPNYYTPLFTSKRLDDIFREFPLYYTRNVDVVTYENGVKEVHNEEGRVVASTLYDYYSNGCSIRILNPQTYDQKVHVFISTFQEYFGTMVGANVYLTPPGSQGFAPHFDDIEAFILQLEGRKHWKLYKPKDSDSLPRDSSKNFTHEEIGEPISEVTLNAGDLLYFPRGTIHEGYTDESAHSLHITISVYQHTAYVDLLEHIVPDALKKACMEDINFRMGLPVNYLKHVGHVNKDIKSTEKDTIINKVKHLMQKMIEFVDVDQAADKLGRRFIYDSMPPVLSKVEVKYTSKYDGDYMQNGKVYNRVEIGLDTEVRLVRYYALRLVIEERNARIYYNTDNSKVYHGEEEQFLVIDDNLIPCIKKLQNIYPKFIDAENLPGVDNIAKMQLVSSLWERGLLVTNGSLPSISEDNSSDEMSDRSS